MPQAFILRGLWLNVRPNQGKSDILSWFGADSDLLRMTLPAVRGADVIF